MKDKDFCFSDMNGVAKELRTFAKDHQEKLGENIADELNSIADQVDDWIEDAERIEGEWEDVEEQRDEAEKRVMYLEEELEKPSITPENLYDEQKMEILDRIYKNYTLEQLTELEKQIKVL